MFYGSLASKASLRVNEMTCPMKYQRVSHSHTACLEGNHGSSEPIVEGVSVPTRSYIVRMHNYYRSSVHQYYEQPPAANMQRMYWDDELAMLAQKWASHCLWQHDEQNNRNVPGSYPVGQNLALGHRGWSAVIRHWHAEAKHLDFGKGKTHHKSIGHYTQMVWAESGRVGCGYARCNGTESFYVCNYAPTGNFIANQFTPYKAGPSASSCPKYRKGTLCDCGGKVCKNGGTLDLTTCQCKCINKPWIEQTGDCSLKCDKAEDFFVCSLKGGSWGRNHCARYVNVPFEFCPITCGLCPGDGKEFNQASRTNTTKSTLSDLLWESVGSQPTADDADVDEKEDYSDGSVLDGAFYENTTPISIAGHDKDSKLAEATTKSAKLAIPAGRKVSTDLEKQDSTALASPEDDFNAELPDCLMDHEQAKCGQPNARGYYHPMYCQYGMDYHCPAMCGKCKVSRCIDYADNEYVVGDTWMNEFGKYTCTASGVDVQRGCYLEKVGVIISANSDYSYQEENINWQCNCSADFSLSCKGVWSPI